MGLFRGKKSRQVISEPVPDWDDTRWRSHLRSNALGTEHHCAMYLEMINADRKEAARTFQNDDDIRARSVTESAIRNKRIVTALTALSPISTALYKRSEPLGGYTSLAQIPEPARSGIVTIVYAAGRLPMSYLTDIVSFLREQFGSVHIDQIQQGRGDLDTLVNPTVQEALTPGPASQSDVDHELASAVKEYFGLTIASSQTAPPSAAAYLPQTTDPPPLAAHSHSSSELRRPQTTPLSPSFKSSDVPDPSSPHILSDSSRALPSRPALLSPDLSSSPSAPIFASLPNSKPASPPPPSSSSKRSRASSSSVVSPSKSSRDHLHNMNPVAPVPSPPPRLHDHLAAFSDSDEMLLARYEHLRQVLSV